VDNALRASWRPLNGNRFTLLRGKVVPATGPNQHWSMDFVHDQMHDGRKFRILTVIDQWSRESVSLEANFRLTGRNSTSGNARWNRPTSAASSG
jgi:transposase InsO family protein